MSQATLDPQAEARLRRRRIIISVIVVSIAVHVIGGILAGVWIVARFILATPTTFEVKKQIRIAAEEREHRMNMVEFDAARPKRVQAHRRLHPSWRNPGLPNRGWP